jgi:predicted amidophosphoribosyltransferase
LNEEVMPRSLPFASCYVYAPHGAGASAAASRRLCARVKTIDPLWLPHYAACVLHASCDDVRLAALFAPDALLVPVPGSAPTPELEWTALQLAIALKSLGLGLRVWPGLRREFAVRKSATAPSAARPSVRQHFESFSVRPSAQPIERILLIDDVITKGRTALAAATRLRSAFPDADVRVFALIRTLGFADQLAQLTAWCHGVVRWAGGDARREP